MSAALVALAALALGPPSSPLRAALIADGYIAVPLTLIGNGTLYMVNCKYGEHILKLGLDTGAGTFMVLDAEVAKRLGLPVVARGSNVEMAGDRAVDISYLPKLSIGNYSTRGGTVVLTDFTFRGRGAVVQLGVKLDGLLGHECLEDNDAIIDYPSSTLFLRPPSELDLPRLGGDWACVLYEKEGVIAPPEDAARNPLRVDGDTARFGLPPDQLVMRMILNDRRRPKKLVLWKPVDGGRMFTTGIYRLAGDELTLCLPIDPTKATVVRDFTTARGSNSQLLVFRRTGK